ncbi:alpha-L-fucosidase [Paenibacillus sp. GCM10028914]|uniref:alpha-L-fucosidase n=1 Tax=Paenibacillus sp. GCM10028914 TaxID=3273416 RepID=UPI003623BA07
MAGTKKDAMNNGVHDYTAEDMYVRPHNPEVLEALDKFRDHKLGFMIHWSPACQLGIYESWCMSDDSADWSKKDVDWTDDMNEFRQQYRNLRTTFNPIRFQPEVWADLAKECGFQYLLFTTKHHDGFCMWDTETTDYKVTSPNTPFSSNRYADICRHLFDAFRERGMDVHAYFSKPDWNTPYYWSPDFTRPDGKTDRNVNYDVAEHPELWEKFVQMTHRQITEIMTNYGRIEALWLDGGWVRPDNKGQDVRIGEIVERIRETTQPHLMAVDRTVGGPYENFITPEQTVPDHPIMVPWESCVTVGKRFSFNYDDEFKSARQLVHMLVNIIAKGGNLALNIAPQPDGRLPAKGMAALRDLGTFLKRNGEAVYGTRECAPYMVDGMAFTRKGSMVYAFHLYPDDSSEVRDSFILPNFGQFVSVSLLSDDGEVKAEEIEEGKIRITVLSRTTPETPYADVFRIELRDL